jgi:periplasmic protein CpxP/Spy
VGEIIHSDFFTNGGNFFDNHRLILFKLKFITMKVLQFLFLFICMGAMAQAQPPADTSRGRGPRVDMYKDLNLTQDQQEKVKAIQEKQRTESEAVRNNSSLSREQQREQMMEIRKKYSEQIDVILTPEQREKLKAKQKEMQEQMEKRRNGGGGPGGQG